MGKHATRHSDSHPDLALAPTFGLAPTRNEYAPPQISDLEHSNIEQALRIATGIRRSPRLCAAAAIYEFAQRCGRFNRRQILYALGGAFGEMCLDRALADLEAAGVIKALEGMHCGWGGAYYDVEQDPRCWHHRCPERQAARRHRNNKGRMRGLADVNGGY